MKTDSIKKNLLFQIINQVATTIYPLITYPYISRVFGPTGLGEYSFTNSVLYYFLIIANLGIVNYGSREIAKHLNNSKELNKNFWGIYICRSIAVFISIIAYIGYLLLFENKYMLLGICQLVQLIAVFIDVSWFFSGIQKFKVTSLINTIIKFISIGFTFTLVKTENDIYVYILILGISNIIGNILLCFQLKKYIHFIKLKDVQIKKHIKPLLILCIPIIAMSLYKYMDKIMIELLSTTYELGLYEAAEKIINIPIGVITAFGVVMLPKMSQMISDGQKDKSLKVLESTLNYSLIISIAMAFGIIAITPTFVPIFLGNDFIQSENLIIYLSISIIFTTWANMIRAQYLIPNNRDREFIVSVFLGAIINVILNSILIPRFSSLGAVIGTIFAEFTVALIHSLYSKKDLKIITYIKDSVFYIIPAIIMVLIVRLIESYIGQNIISLLVQIISGAIIYLLITVIHLFKKKDEVFMVYLNKIRKSV